MTEYVVSTFTPSSPYRDFAAEGYAMVYALAEALRGAGAKLLITASRELGLDLSHLGSIVWTELSTYFTVLESMREVVDHAIAIAPPLELVKASRVLWPKLLGPPPHLVEVLSDKYRAHEFLRRCGVVVPETLIVEGGEGKLRGLRRGAYVVKPCMLAGSECVYLARGASEVGGALARALKCDPLQRAVVQEFVEGTHGSLSALFRRGRPVLVSLNLQIVGLEPSTRRIVYLGNVVPAPCGEGAASRALHVAYRLGECLGPVDGYLGLDVVWDGEHLHVVEANPRPTTSFVGLAKLYPRIGVALLHGRGPPSELLNSFVEGQVLILSMPADWGEAFRRLRGRVTELVKVGPRAVVVFEAADPAAVGSLVEHLLKDLGLRPLDHLAARSQGRSKNV